jgi:oligopeptide transport system substrate-binding protein
MKKQTHWSRFGGVMTAGLMLAAGLSAAPAGALTLHRGIAGDLESLDPHKTSTTVESAVLRELLEGLVIDDGKGTVAKGVAESWSISEDGMVYTFKIRPNATWSNGDPVTAGDFVYSVRRILDPATKAQYASLMYPIKGAQEINEGKADKSTLGVEATDAKTLKITLKASTPYFLSQLTHQTGLPVNEKAVTAHGPEWTKPGKHVGNGAFTLAEVMPQAHYKLAKNGKFHDAANVKLDEVMYYPIEDRSAALKRFRAGEIQVYNDAPNDQIEWMRANMPKELRIAPYAGIYYYTINTSKPPFNDVRVRKALSLAINRELLVEKVTLAGELPGYSFVPPGTNDYTSQMVDWKPMSQADREKEAAKLLTDAGFGPGKPLKFQLDYNTSENHKKIAVAIQSMWKKLGVDVELFNTELKVHYANLREGNYAVARAGWIADYNDAQNYLFLAETAGGPLNYTRWNNEPYNKLMAQAAVTNDLAKRRAMLEQAEKMLMEGQPYIPIYYYVSKNLVSQKVLGWNDNVFDAHPSRFLSISN